MAKNKNKGLFAPPTEEEILALPPPEPKGASHQRAAFAKGDLMGGVKEARALMEPPEFVNDALAAAGGFIDRVTRGNLRGNKTFQDQMTRDETMSPTSHMLGQGAGEAAYGLANLYAPAAAPAKIAAAIPGASTLTRMLVGAGLGAAEKPAEGDSRLENAGYGAATSLGMDALGGIGRFSGDRLMQLAIGKTRMQPGLGESLIKENVWAPTRDGMKNQVARKKEKIFQKMRGEVVGKPALHSSAPVQQEVFKVGKSMRIPGDVPAASLDKPALDKIDDYVKDIASRGDEDLLQMLSRRGAAGGQYRDAFSEYPGMGKDSLTDAISKAEQRGYSNILKDNAPAFKKLDPRYSTLASASESLAKPRPIYQGSGGIGTIGATLGAGGYYATKNPLTALGIGGAAALASTPGGQSLAAHFLNRTGRGMPILTPAMINALIGEIKAEQGAE